jgi:hypothetical protein
MTNLGVFRDEFYNAIHALTEAQAATGPTATGVVPASQLAGAAECFVSLSGTSQTFTTDTAANIIAQLQTAVATAQKANVGGFASALGSTPPLGVPNLFNMSWVINFSGAGIVTGGTLAGGTGVTLAAIGATLSSSALAAGAVSVYVATVTGPASITLTRVQ